MTVKQYSLQGVSPVRWSLIALLLVGACSGGRVPSSSYQGDGKLWVTNKGQNFHIRFNDFDMSKPFHAQYKIVACPHAQSGLEVFLQVTPALQEEREQLLHYTKGVLSIRAAGADGASLFECESPLKTWLLAGVCTDGRLVADEFFYKSGDTKSVIPREAINQQRPITLRVDYEPAPTVTSIPMRLTGSIHAIGG